MSTLARIALAAGITVAPALAQNGLASLKTVRVPRPTGLSQYVRDQKALEALGKALFWDVQVGSDGATACATCHFHAGADHRAQNQLASPHDASTSFRPNQALTLADFPFRKLANPLDNASAVERNRRQVTGSAGVIYRRFVDVPAGSAVDDGLEEPGPSAFAINGIKVRQVTGRNTPSVINSVFYVFNFWDGRASNIFSGATPFGESDTVYKALVLKDGRLESEPVRLDNASLVSQAVGPALNEVEMSYEGRTWLKLARKTYGVAPLARQRVAADDSILGSFANPDGDGLLPQHTYLSMVRQAFRPDYWQSETPNDDGVLQVEHNFPIFFGLAIDAYEALLISDDSRFDRFMDGDSGALTSLERQGINVFNGNSECHECHQGPEFSAASFTNVRGRGQRASALPNVLGFFRTGVSPVAEDIGAGGKDSFGVPLFPGARNNEARGVFKSPSLRNVELTGPYFHDGGQATLEQVVEFYSRQGDFPQDGNLGPGIGRIRMSADERAAIVALMKSLTDDRVRFERAPFDHPAICIPIGHPESGGVLEVSSAPGATASAVDKWALIPAVGKSGNTVPLQTFEELLQGVGNDGTRAHTLAEPCPAQR